MSLGLSEMVLAMQGFTIRKDRGELVKKATLDVQVGGTRSKKISIKGNPGVTNIGHTGCQGTILTLHSRDPILSTVPFLTLEEKTGRRLALLGPTDAGPDTSTYGGHRVDGGNFGQGGLVDTEERESPQINLRLKVLGQVNQ